jgi:hypothetical protein
MFADDTTIPLPALYVEAADPTTVYTDGRSFAKRMWLDTSTGTIGTLKKRNPANDGWNTLINLDAAAATFTTEQVQDIVGAMLTDSATIDQVYDDGAGTVTAAVIDDSITNTKLANMAQATIKGRAAGAGTGDPSDLSATQVRTILIDMQRWTLNFTASGDAYIPADVAMTIDVGVAAIGTGTLAYEKSTAVAPGTFSATTLPATLEAGAWLKVTVSAITGFKAVELKRTA